MQGSADPRPGHSQQSPEYYWGWRLRHRRVHETPASYGPPKKMTSREQGSRGSGLLEQMARTTLWQAENARVSVC